MFACNFHGGKGMDDLMSARDFYLQQSKKAKLETPNAFVWTPFKGSFTHDFLWLTDHADLKAFASYTDARDAVSEMAAVRVRFESVANCSSGITMRRRIYDGGETPVTTPPAFVAASACNLNAGVRIADLDDLWEHINDVLNELGKHKAFHLYVSTPFTTSPSSPDVFIHRVNNSASVWADRVEALSNSESGQELERHANSVLSCDTSLWYAHWVVSG